MCPKYWCTKKGEERPLTQKDIDEGKHGCGEVIKDSKNPKSNEMILMFQNNHYNDKGEYVQNNPGLSQSHPNEKLCVPCCFKKPWDSKQSKENLDKCINLNTTDQHKKQYVVNYDKIPDKDRIGYLPLPLQKLFNVEGKIVDVDNTFNLVTMGVDKNDSFISTLTYYYNIMNHENITNQEFRNNISKKIQLNNYYRSLTNEIIEMFNY